MGVTNLLGKLFGSEAGKNQALLRAYGKLPMYAEYRRLEVAPGTPTLFSQWMDAGRLAWVRSPSKSPQGLTRASRLLIHLPGAKELVLASLWDSRDNLGRVFPFAFFVVCPPDALGESALHRWVCASTMFRTFDQLHQQLSALGQGGDFYKMFRGRTLPIRPDDLDARVQQLESEARRVDAQAWFESAVGNKQFTAEAWFAGLLRRVEKWKAQPALIEGLALNLPLADTAPFGAQAAAWLRWTDAAVARCGRTAQIIMPADAERGGSLNLLVRDVLPDDFQLLTNDDHAYGFIERPAAAQLAADSTVPAEVPVTGSLYDWLVNHAPV